MTEYQYILSIALGQGLVLAFFLLASKYYRSLANTWLAIALILISTQSIIDILGGNYRTDSLLLEFFLHDLELNFLIYVPMYYYFKITTSKPNTAPYFNPYLLLPFIIDTMLNIILVINVPLESIEGNAGIQLFYIIENYVSIAFNLFLAYQSYQLIKAYAGNPSKKVWLIRICQSTFLLLFYWVLIAFSESIIGERFSIFVSPFYIIISIWIFWLIYNGIVNLKLIEDRKDINLRLQDKSIPSNHNRFSVSPQAIQVEIDKKQDIKTQQTSNPELFQNHFKKISALVISESLYRNENLSIDDIAERIQMSSGYISKIIKQATNKSFPTWINELRVSDVKVMFNDQEFNNYTTLSIGLEAGFKSKSAFYASFKNLTGETPAKFRKKKS